MSTRPVILVVDDEPQILRMLRAALDARGYAVEAVATAEDALSAAASATPDMAVIDIMLPGEIDGVEVCRRLREWTAMPILILSAIGSERQKVKALDTGADDYLTKPFGMGELTARVRALLRRAASVSAAGDPPLLECGDLTIDYVRRLVAVAGAEVRLTPIEYDILRYLSRNADRVVTHRQLLAEVWGPAYTDDTQLLRVHIGNVRRKIEADPSRPRLIFTEPGIGYRFRSGL